MEALYEFKLVHHQLRASPVLSMKLSMLHTSLAAHQPGCNSTHLPGGYLHDSAEWLFPVQEPAFRPGTVKATVNRTLCPLLQELVFSKQ